MLAPDINLKTRKFLTRHVQYMMYSLLTELNIEADCSVEFWVAASENQPTL